MRRPNVLSTYLSPSLVFGTLLSTATALLLLLFDVTDFGTSFVIGLSGTTLSAVLDLIDRSEFANIFKGPTWLRVEVARLGELAQAVSARNVKVLDEEVRAIVTRAVRDAETVAGGRVEREGTDSRHMLDLVAKCERRLSATTNIARGKGASRLEWWESEFGKRYWQENVKAIARGVTIERVFIYEELDDRLSEIVERQRKAGVKACLIDAASVPSAYRANVAVFDRSCAWEARMDAYSLITHNVFSYGPVDIRRTQEVVDTLLVRARSDEDLPADAPRRGRPGRLPRRGAS
jgi:hypothetical protein